MEMLSAMDRTKYSFGLTIIFISVKNITPKAKYPMLSDDAKEDA